MTFNSLKELPTAIKRHLPTHAQKIFKEAFNSVRQGKAQQ
ncbi:hypothetical protein GCM10011391_29450 [Pullulanibacillus camelliae]|uniref:Uncharacterized protein n=1 Tax=Pullulanibacillus camelliae TaxID=1707096 RepID=A0A8J3DXW0_9BACL|nr:ChaB family protein [Pullulanibacillus camelliae]GGE48734.1 hypothetical protein GCM10011391_29450 [Pullulanibacillus camelliae]